MKKYIPNLKFFIMLSIVLINILLPTMAFAQTTGFFTVPTTDVAKTEFIDYLAGPLTGANTTSPFGSVIGIFNGAILILGGIYLAYIYIAGTAQGAHDGQFLGKRWSTMWVPIRMLLGSTLAFPSLTGGFCLAQWLVVWLTLQGVGFADQIWTAYAGDPFGGMTSNSLNTYSKPYQVARQLFLNNLCVDLFNQALAQNTSGSSSLASGEQASINSLFGNTNFKWVDDSPTGTGAGNSKNYNYILTVGSDTQWAITRFFNGNANATNNAAVALGADPNSVCGSAVLVAPIAANPTTSTSGGTTSTSTNSTWVSTSTYATLSSQIDQSQADINAITDGFNAIHSSEMNTLQTAAASLATAYVANPTSTNVASQLASMATSYQTALGTQYTTAMGQMSSDAQSFQTDIKNDGFIMAGAYYMKIAKMQDAVSSAMSNYPHVAGSAPMQSFTTRVASTGMGGAFDVNSADTNKAVFDMLAKEVFGQYQAAAKASVDPTVQNSAFDAADLGLNDTGDSTSLGSFVNKIANNSDIGPSDIFGAIGVNDNSNPLFLAHDIGSKMVTWAWAILGIGLAAGIFSTGIAMFAISLWVSLSVPGALLTTVIPMMPYMIWMGSVFSWFVLFMEAMIASPVWAVAHLSPEGEGFQGAARSGYMILLNLTLRPALMIFGFIAAIIAMQPIGHLINVTYNLAFGGATSGGTPMNRITSIIAGCGLYAFMMITTTKKVFELIHLVPERIMRWMGGSGDNLSHAQDFGHGGDMMAAKGMQGANALGRSAVGAASGAARGLKSAMSKIGGDKDAGGAGGSGGGGGDGSGGGSSGVARLAQLSNAADSAHQSSLGSSNPARHENSARQHSKLAQSHLGDARKADPAFDSAYKQAQSQDAASQKAGQPANATSDLVSSKVQDAQYDQGSGKTLSPSQTSLLSMNAANNSANDAMERANTLRERNSN